MRRFSADEERVLLAPVALERARVLAPFVLVGIAAALALSEPTGIRLSSPVIAWNVFTLTSTALLTVALVRRRIPVDWSHRALAVVWWAPICGTLISQYFSGNPQLTFVLLIEVASAAIMLQTRWVLGSFLVLDLVWIPMALRDGGEQAPLYLCLIATAQLFSTVFHRLFRISLLRAELHRRTQEETARELAHQLVELRRSEEERGRLADQLLHAQRLEAAGTLAAGLAHDMNNILGSIRSFAELLQEIAGPEAQADLGQIVAQSERGAVLTRGLLAFSRRGQYRKQVLDLDAIVATTLPLLTRTLPKSIEIRSELSATGARIDGDPVQLGQVIVNLAVNAADAMAGKGVLVIASELVVHGPAEAGAMGLAPGPHVRLRVTDDGAGMDEATRARAFEPFFTTKPVGQGTGLGLSTVWGVVHGHHGTVRVSSRIGAGTTFSIDLPLTAEPISEPVPPVVEPRPRRSTVLVVDDEPAVRAGTMRLLQRRGLEVLEACDGAEALEVYARHRDQIGLVILDMGMPVMSGPECFARLRMLSDVPVLVATGYASDEHAQSLITQGATLIEKPFSSAELGREVARLLAQT